MPRRVALGNDGRGRFALRRQDEEWALRVHARMHGVERLHLAGREAEGLDDGVEGGVRPAGSGHAAHLVVGLPAMPGSILGGC